MARATGNNQQKRMPWRRGALAWACLLLALLCPRLAQAEPGLSIEAELLRPGVRLLAVEFYATWCKPCMAAVPRWKALHDKYRDKGLRLVVIAVQDDGRCVNPGWNPDRMICDEDGRISEAFRVGQNLPAAFLWSWTGNLLVQRGHVDQVASAIDAELASLPRVTIGTDRAGSDAVALAEVAGLLRSELRKSGKLDVVATVDEQKLLEQVRRESQKSGYAENTQCKLGEQMAANSLLKASLTQGKERRLMLQLFSVEKGCLTQSGMARWTPDNPDRAVAVAVGDLLARLRTETQMPGAAERAKLPFGGRKIEQGKDVDTDEVDEVIIDFDSTPRGAAVFIGDKMMCPQTPCSKGVPLGKRMLTMSSTDHVTRTESIDFGKETGRQKWALAPDFALLTVECDAPNLQLKLDGKPWGTCPQRERRVNPGKHTLTLDSPCHLGVEEKLQVARGDKKTVALPGQPRTAAVTIKARDDLGNDLRAVARLDGELLGAVPGSFKVPMCGRKLEVKCEQMGVWSTVLDLKEAEKRQVLAEMKRAVGDLAGQRGEPAPRPVVVVPGGHSSAHDFDIMPGKQSARDSSTGLEWQRAPMSGLFSGKTEWKYAKASCESLDLGGTGWRLPEVRELAGLLDPRGMPLLINSKFFEVSSSRVRTFWTATKAGGGAQVIDFTDGSVENAQMTDSQDANGRVEHSLWCVRGDPPTFAAESAPMPLGVVLGAPPADVAHCRHRVRTASNFATSIMITDFLPIARDVFTIGFFRYNLYDDDDGSLPWAVSALAFEGAFWYGFVDVVSNLDANRTSVPGWSALTVGLVGQPIVDYVWSSVILNRVKEQCLSHAQAPARPILVASSRVRTMPSLFVAPMLGGTPGLALGGRW